MTTTIMHAHRLIDGTGAAPLADPVLVIAEGRVRDVFAGKVPDGAVPEGAVEMYLPGCTLLPGLIDAHVHLNLPGDTLPTTGRAKPKRLREESALPTSGCRFAGRTGRRCARRSDPAAAGRCVQGVEAFAGWG